MTLKTWGMKLGWILYRFYLQGLSVEQKVEEGRLSASRVLSIYDPMNQWVSAVTLTHKMKAEISESA